MKKLGKDLDDLLSGKHPKPHPKPRPKITLLIPFHTNNKQRKKVFKWVLEYWKDQLPDAEIIIGHSNAKPFCKTEALNNAADRATGKVLVILDADTYMPGWIIDKAADRILEELEHGNHLWYVPYKHLYRLNKQITAKIIASDPKDPLQIPSPPPEEYLDDDGQKRSYGRRYGAMVMVFPREALEVIKCFDERFRGWGGEDVALLRALDTLWGKHKTTPNDVLHLWHPYFGHSYKTRTWMHQKHQLNAKLAMQYHRATRHPSKMQEIIEAACKEKGKRHVKFKRKATKVQ